MYKSENTHTAWLAKIFLFSFVYLSQKSCHCRQRTLEKWQESLTRCWACACMCMCVHCVHVVCQQTYDTPHYWGSHTYLICLITDSFDVGFSPSSWYPVNYFSIVHIIARNFSPSSLIWLLPSKNHWVTKTFKTSDIIGWRWCRCCNMKSSWVDRNASMILPASNCLIGDTHEGTRSCGVKLKRDTSK